VVGPSASGKSSVAIELALLIDGEVVSVDSMQCYRGMNIGTAKPSAADQSRVRHHLIDLSDVTVGFDAAAFRATALTSITDILHRNKTPVLCGGTGFYFSALLRGLGSGPASSPALRESLEAMSLEELLRELHECDPETYAAIDRRNHRRVIRAVEVWKLTGRPFSQQWPRRNSPASGHPAENESLWHSFGLLRDPEDLRARIEERVDSMFREGLVEETRHLLKCGLARNRTALQAIGYRQVAEHLAGERALTETRELIAAKTRQFTRRQMTWFRRQMQVTWLGVNRTETPLETATRIVRILTPE
jgi:tRNA dimethylallyltransferase